MPSKSGFDPPAVHRLFRAKAALRPSPVLGECSRTLRASISPSSLSVINDRTLDQPDTFRLGSIAQVLEEGKLPNHRALSVLSIPLKHSNYVTTVEMLGFPPSLSLFLLINLTRPGIWTRTSIATNRPSGTSMRSTCLLLLASNTGVSSLSPAVSNRLESPHPVFVQVFMLLLATSSSSSAPNLARTRSLPWPLKIPRSALPIA